ncbi:MAG: M1 family metallopeptidase [Pirellulaceae bacterium]
MKNPLRSFVCLAIVAALAVSVAAPHAAAQFLPNGKHSDSTDRFFQIESWLPTPDEVRLASGAPGPQYWQQRADYQINVTLDDQNQRLSGTSRITYRNQSPHTLRYIWIQLDQNIFEPTSDAAKISSAPSFAGRVPFNTMKSILARESFDGGYRIQSVTDANGVAMDHTIVKTMMRVDLDTPLAPGESTQINIQYEFKIVDAKVIRARSGYEYFKDDENYIYEIAQFFPRVAAYTDYAGWQHKQFLGRGEFTLELGDYQVSITAPKNMIVGATGELRNADEVLDPKWTKRLNDARQSEKAIFVITPEEAKANEANKSSETKTWIFEAKNVRDFAFAASRKFIWDAMGVKVDGQTVMSMSYYPGEAEPLWSQYSTEAIAHTLQVYGRYSFAYPYPVAISVNGPVYGMEYPMICFNGPRPEDDGTYSKATKYGLISVVIHEVGHNFFPMIVNSDERQWTWMDEGLNTFLQYLAEQEWEDDYPSRRGDPEKIVPYMRGGNQRPIMTGSEEILQFGDNAYGKPATALNVLRETVLGRELFDFAFREYARRWKFKRPAPADFFRTMEDASGVDLDWFWRGWFYSTDHVDIGIDSVRWYKIDAGDPDETAERKRQERDKEEETLSKELNKDLPKRIEWQPGLKDFYNSPEYDPLKAEESDRKAFQKFLDGLDSEERTLLRRKTNFYVLDFRNHGGLVMPIIFRVHYNDNTTEMVTLPAEIWRSDSRSVDKLLVSDKEIVRLELDPRKQTADVDYNNNFWPPKIEPSRFKLFKDATSKNPMQKAEDKKKAKDKGKDKDDGDQKEDEKDGETEEVKEDAEKENEPA